IGPRRGAGETMNDAMASSARASRPAAKRSTTVMRAVSLSACSAAMAFALCAPLANTAAAQSERACETYGGFVDVKTGRALDRGELFRDLAAKTPVVLLGEGHTDVDHHRWQLHTLAALLGRGGNLVVGFESFPRRLQPVLDDWIAGKLSEDEFLRK